MQTAFNRCVGLWNRIRRPVTLGARAIIVNEDRDSVLLVRHTYSSGWYLPGGGIKKHEPIADGLKRELWEEISFKVDDGSLELFGVYSNFFGGKSDTFIVFLCQGSFEKNRRSIEIEEQKFFRFDALPENVSPGTGRRLDEYMRGGKAAVGIW